MSVAGAYTRPVADERTRAVPGHSVCEVLLRRMAGFYCVGRAAGVLAGQPLRVLALPAIIIGALFSIFVSVGIVRRLGPVQGQASVRAESQVLAPVSLETAFDQCVAAIHSLDGATVRHLDPASGRIRARVARSPESWGERVVIALAPRSGQTEVTVPSRPTVPLTLLDQGKNERNVQHVIDRLSRH